MCDVYHVMGIVTIRVLAGSLASISAAGAVG